MKKAIKNSKGIKSSTKLPLGPYFGSKLRFLADFGTSWAPKMGPKMDPEIQN